jgi:type I restriction enzyme S subunit
MAGEVETLDLIGDLPPSWKVARFGDVLEGGTRNGIYKAKNFHGRGAKIVNMGELFAHPRLRDVPMKRVELSDSEMEKSCLKKDDLLFARRSLVAEGAGKCIVVAEVKEPTTFESSIIRARPNPHVVDSLFLYYLFNSPYGAYVLQTIRRQVAVSGITGTDLVELPVPLPPLAEQKAIAAVLGALDDKIELNRRMNAKLEEMARALFQSWFVDFDPVRAKLDGREPVGLDSDTAAFFPEHFDHGEHDMLPVGWGLVAIEEVCAINAWTLGKYDDLETLEYVEISEVSRGNIANIANYQRGEEPSRARRRLRHGDTVLSTVRPDRGSYFLSLNPPENRVCSTGFAVLTPSKVPWSYLHVALTLPEVSDHLGQMADGGAYPTVRPEVIGAMQVSLPKNPKVLEAFHRTCAPLFEQAEANRTQSRTLATLRDTLLPRLLSGELKVARFSVVDQNR